MKRLQRRVGLGFRVTVIVGCIASLVAAIAMQFRSSESMSNVVDVAVQLPKSSRYYYDLTHYNIAGAEEVASIIFRDLSVILSNPPARQSLQTN